MVLVAVVSAGCAPPEAHLPATVEVPPARAGRAGAPEATIRVLDHLGFPYRLSKVIVALDGAVMKNEKFAPDRRAPATIAVSTELAPGEHTLHFLAETQVALTASGPECAVTLRSYTRFAAEAGNPAEITADLYLRGAERRFGDRLDVHTRVREPRLEGWIAERPKAAEEARCQAMAAAEAAVCRVEGTVAEATRQHDVIKVLCNRDKLDQMRVLARMRDEARARAEVATPALRRPLAVSTDDQPPRDPDGSGPRRRPGLEGPDRWADEIEQRQRIEVLEQRIVALGREAEQCVAEDPAYGPSTTVTADETCFARLPEIDADEPLARVR
jgi:hypothetical protein